MNAGIDAYPDEGWHEVIVTVNGLQASERMIWKPKVSGDCKWAPGGQRLDHPRLEALNLRPGQS